MLTPAPFLLPGNSLNISTIDITGTDDYDHTTSDIINSLTNKADLRPCGHRRDTVYGKSGDHFIYHMFCGRWRDRECPVCWSFRARGVQGRIAEIRNQYPNAKVVILPKDYADDFVGHLNRVAECRSLYYRLPTNDGDYIIFNAARDGKNISMELDYELLANTPLRRRPSGNLGKKQEEPKETVTINVPDFQCYAPSGGVTKSWNETMELTKDFQPFGDTPEELAASIELLCHQRMSIFETRIYANDGMIADRITRREKLDLSDIHWKGNVTKLPPYSLDPSIPPIWWRKTGKEVQKEPL